LKSSESFDDSHAITIPNAVAGGSSRVLRPGDIIGGSYKLKSLLGRGGMGYVFCAEHVSLGLEYALKILAPEQLNDISRRRFEVEGRAIANLDHVNIVKVHNMGLDAGDCPFYVMDLLEGQSLADSIGDGAEFPLQTVVDIFIQIAEGLGYAHSKGIVHRDIKPSNIILVNERQRRRVKIVDFGIAKLLPSADLHSQSQTATGEVFGSPYYMSPEQCMGAKIDEASDVYSLGCTLYETLTGAPPFRGENPMQTVMMHQNAKVPSVSDSARGAKCPPAVDKLLSKMMAKRPADRYQSMRQLIHDLERLLQGKEIGGAASSAAATVSRDEEQGQREGRQSPANVALSAFCIIVFAVVLVISVQFKISVSHKSAGSDKVAADSQVKTPDAVTSQLHKRNVKEIEDGSSPTDLMGPESRGDGLKTVDVFVDTVWTSPAVKNFAHESGELPGWKKIAATCPPIVSKTVMVNGEAKRRFNFPKKSMGNVLCETKGAIANYEAAGEKLLPHKALCLAVGFRGWHFIFSVPELIGKVGKNEFVGLLINGQNLNPEACRKKGLTPESEGAEEMLKYASKWPYLHRLALSKIRIEDSLLTAINTLPQLDYLEIYHCTLNTKLFVEQPFLLKVHTLLLSDYTDLKPLLEKLKQNKTLTCLKLFDANIRVEDLQMIDTFPALNALQLSEYKFAPLIPQLKKMSKIRHLLIGGNRLTHIQIHELTSMPNLQALMLGAETYSTAEEKEYLRQFEPKVQLCPFD